MPLSGVLAAGEAREVKSPRRLLKTPGGVVSVLELLDGEIFYTLREDEVVIES